LRCCCRATQAQRRQVSTRRGPAAAAGERGGQTRAPQRPLHAWRPLLQPCSRFGAVPLRSLLAALALGVYGQFDFHLLSLLALRRAPAVEANLVNDLWPLPIVVLAPLLLCGLRLAPRHVVAASFGSTQTLHQAGPEFGSGSPYVTLCDAMRRCAR
jgi:hypothetical protein